MLSQIIDSSLKGLKKEADLYLPFATMLRAKGYLHVNVVHGANELGRDVIALSPDRKTQFNFQIKKDKITPSLLNSEILEQLNKCFNYDLQHIDFHPIAEQVVILVVPGTLTAESHRHFQNFKQVKLREGKHIDVWERPRLVKYFSSLGEQRLDLKASVEDVGLDWTGGLFQIYGASLRNQVGCSTLERFSRYWLTGRLEPAEIIAQASLDNLVLGSALGTHGRAYEMFYLDCLLARQFLHLLSVTDVRHTITPFLEELKRQLIEKAHYFTSMVESVTIDKGQRLYKSFVGSSAVYSYNSFCMKMIESYAFCLLCDSSNSPDKLVNFIRSEPGSQRPTSDSYAVSVFLAAMALSKSGKTKAATALIQNTFSWILDAFESGRSFADVDAPPLLEMLYFTEKNFQTSRSSFCSRVLLDSAYLIENHSLYRDMVIDLRRLQIVTPYFLYKDPVLQITSHEGRTIYPNVVSDPNLQKPNNPAHWDFEPDLPEFFAEIGLELPIAAIIALRDRYLPRLWL